MKQPYQTAREWPLVRTTIQLLLTVCFSLYLKSEPLLGWDCIQWIFTSLRESSLAIIKNKSRLKWFALLKNQTVLFWTASLSSYCKVYIMLFNTSWHFSFGPKVIKYYINCVLQLLYVTAVISQTLMNGQGKRICRKSGVT